MSDHKQAVQKQFGDVAANYATNSGLRSGATIERSPHFDLLHYIEQPQIPVECVLEDDVPTIR